MGLRRRRARRLTTRTGEEPCLTVTTGVLQPALDVFRAVLISVMTTRAQAVGRYLLLDPFVDERPVPGGHQARVRHDPTRGAHAERELT